MEVVLNLFGMQWVMPGTAKEALALGSQDGNRSSGAWRFAPLAIMWVIWNERNRRALKGWNRIL